MGSNFVTGFLIAIDFPSSFSYLENKLKIVSKKGIEKKK